MKDYQMWKKNVNVSNKSNFYIIKGHNCLNNFTT